jgi:glycosyltransferase involved in cell wall biosynthesis
MNILALEPYYGGSHKAFLDGWIARSGHKWTVLHLPPYKWKWRMRHAAVTFADQLRTASAERKHDLVFCCDMLNLAEFKGLAPEPVRKLPAVVYFHENQLTYPVRQESERDYHFALTNIVSALAADAVWFNSAWHREEFLSAVGPFLGRMPDYQLDDAADRVRAKSAVQPPGVDAFPPRGPRPPGPLRILWAARWEFDKNPEAFFAALRLLRERGVAFRVSVLGERFRDCPAVFDEAKHEFAEQIDRFGYQPTREDYVAALREADVIVSTADHEFFGISVVEAISAGAFPLLPRRLAYPEVLAGAAGNDDFFYDGAATPSAAAHLAARLSELAERLTQGDLWKGDAESAVRAVQPFTWDARAKEMDDALERTISPA